MLAAGLLAKKAVERGLTVPPTVKTSLAPGSRVVTEYLQQDRACSRTSTSSASTSSATAARPASATPARSIRASRRSSTSNDLIAASRAFGQPQLRGARPPDRQGELPDVAAARRRLRARGPRQHRPADRAAREGQRRRGRLPARHLADARRGRRGARARRPTPRPTARSTATSPSRIRSGTRSRRRRARSTSGTRSRPTFRSRPTSRSSAWSRAASATSRGARPLAIFGDSVTTDHISPAGRHQGEVARRASTCSSAASSTQDFNSYGSRRGNHQVMVRGTFANVRIKNLMVAGHRGRRDRPPADRRADAHLRRVDPVPGGGRPAQSSSPGRSTARAARATGRRRGRGFWASRRSSPRASSASTARTSSGWACCRCQFKEGTSTPQTLGLDGTETFDITGLEGVDITPRQDVTLRHPPRERRDRRRCP